MIESTITGLPYEHEIEFNILITGITDERIEFIGPDRKKFSISRPKNRTWNGVNLTENERVTVLIQPYNTSGDKLYAKLLLFRRNL